ncbi:MAG: type II secretion system F family protein [Rhodospirillales bacterium]|nr:type II secretion system F family protein [Alphaproteobacteria bacterium]MCB1838711.1 type II secretion system F family protein [Alphaproteobacteria bacterium]MCB9977641.1 type II secretion system F family protein [Rhodospirillales bacterium]
MAFDLDNETIITVGASLLAAASVIGFAFPFLQKADKKEKSMAIIEKRRKDLYQQTREAARNKQQESISAKDSMSSFFRVQQLAGKMGEKIRDKMLQAGIRNPKAPLRFMIARVVLPVVFVGLGMMFLMKIPEEKKLSDGMSSIILISAALVGFKLPDILVQNMIQKRQQELNLSFPDSLDMMLICVQGGIGLEQTIERVATEVAEHSPILGEELGILSAEMAMLNDRRQALQDFARRVGSGAGKSFATALIQAEQYGTSISQAMRVMSEELRDMRMAEAERKAAALPPKLTVPMILFFLPALFIIILGPAGIKAAAAGVGS